MLFRLTDVSKSYSGHDVLRGVSFQVNPGEKAGLVGRNGAGKSTVFRLICGEEQPDSGEVDRINRLKIGMLGQHVEFDEEESVHTAALSAFKELHDIEAEMRRLEIVMAENPAPEVLERYAELQTRFERQGGFEYTARAEAVLDGLNFSREQWQMSTSQLSGGQKNRLGMVRLLLSDADLLLLDEPTNHLDVATVEWLEGFLESYSGAYVIISHDRYFLDKTCSRIIELENGVAYTFSGNYTKYSAESLLQKEQRRREFENQQAFINKTEAFIRKNLAGQKTKQAKSRRNMLERMERKEAVPNEKKSGDFGLGKVVRTGANVLSAKNLSIGYEDTVLASGLDFTLHRGECLGVIGGNGTGKSTLLKTLLGQIRELGGDILWGTKVNTGYYSQQLEDLNVRNDLIAEMRRVNANAESGELRSFLAGFLFYGEDVFKRVGDLSGGEKGRLALAKLIYSKSNVLILDEPTNHLDIPSREALERALESFDGTIITVSHDRYFLDRIATQILAFEPGGRVELYNGNYTEFHEWKEKNGHAVSAPAHEAKPQRSVPAAATARESGLSKNEIVRMKQRAKRIEEQISELEERLKQISLDLSEPATVRDREVFDAATREYEKVEIEISKLYSEWEALLEKLPA